MQPDPVPSIDIIQPARFAFDEWRFRGVLIRRVLANLIDWIVLAIALGLLAFPLFVTSIVTFGLVSIPMAILGLVVPFAYFILYLGGPSSATPGMKVMDIELRDISGMRPELLQAGLRTVLYSASIFALTPLVLLVVLFNRRQRALHDILSASVVVRTAGDDAA